MTRGLPTLLLLLAVSSARAHWMDVYPVRVTLRADAGTLRVSIEANAMNWGFLAAGRPTADPWPEAYRAQCLDYLKDHFSPLVDGRPLSGRVLGGRTVRPLWRDELRGLIVIHAVYDLPPSGEALTVRPDFFGDEREHVEGRGIQAPPGFLRDYRAILSWPGGGESRPGGAPPLRLPLTALRVSPAQRALESAGIAVRALLGAGGALALLAAAAFFPPGRVVASAGAAGALLLGAGGAAVLGGAPPAYLERALWGGVVLLGLTSILRRGTPAWLGGLALGAPPALRLTATAGAALRDTTGFAGFSWAAFWAATALFLACLEGLRRTVILFYRYYFRILSPDELERQALFHRKLLSRLLGIAGLYWLLQPVIAGRP